MKEVFNSIEYDIHRGKISLIWEEYAPEFANKTEDKTPWEMMMQEIRNWNRYWEFYYNGQLDFKPKCVQEFIPKLMEKYTLKFK